MAAWKDPWIAATAAVTVVCAYLLFANLDHSHLWEDEGATAVVGRTLLATGDIKGWDGRNLVGCPQALCLNADGRIVLPPVMFALTAAGIAIAGDNEIGYRIAHAFCGLLAISLLWSLVRLKLPNATRLHFLIVTFAALSPQLLMYFRASRYYAFSVLAMLACVYAYERWWPRRELRWLVALAVAATLAFLNHYAIGIAGTLSLILCHLMFRGRGTTGTDCLRVGMAAIGPLIICLGYLWWIGIIGEVRWGIPGYTLASEDPTPVAGRLAELLQGVLQAGWISWWILPWFVFFVALPVWKGRASASESYVFRLTILGLVGVIASLVVEVALVKTPGVVGGGNLRYNAFALPLLLAMQAMFVDRLHGESKPLGTVLLLALLLTNVGSLPLKFSRHQPTFRSALAGFAMEIHRPYIDGLRLVQDFLDANAAHDDLVHVAFAPMMHEPLVASVGNRLRLCCIVARHGARHVNEAARREWGDHVWDSQRPDWVISPRPMPDGGEYVLHTLLDRRITWPNPQRPEANLHRFRPPRVENGTRVYAVAESAQ